MRFLKLYESFIQENELLLIVKKGTELFHGTIEPFNKENIRPGGYDEVLWTADNSAIAQTYMPISSKVYINSSEFVEPSKDQDTVAMQIQLGVDYDYSEVKFGNSNRAESYMPAPCFKKITDEYYDLLDEYREAEQEFNKAKKEYTDKLNQMINNGINKQEYMEYSAKQREVIDELEDKVEVLKQKYYENKIHKKKNNFINSKLEALGYKPYRESEYDGNNGWKLKISRQEGKDVIMPANWKDTGRLMIIKPKRDLRIYDYTLGGKREADLNNEDYHKISLFRKIEEAGYDGIRITDHCQSEDQGNFGHLSIGLFRNTLKDLEIDEIPAVHQELEQFYKDNDWETPEYKEYKKSK